MDDLLLELGPPGRGVAPGRSGVAETPGWTLGDVDLSRGALGSLNTYHHLNAD